MALIIVGNKHHVTLSPGPSASQVPNHDNKLFHQVDRCRDIEKHHSNKYSKILQYEHPGMIQDPSICHHK